MAELKDWFVPVASGAAALLGVFNVYLNNQSSQDLERLKTQIVRIGDERKFASEIMQRFDNVVDSKSDRATRISRLEGLMALAGLIQHDADEPGGLDTKGILAVIKAQADSYKGEIVEQARTATGAEADKLQSDYARASAVSTSATAALNKLAADTATQAAAQPNAAPPKPVVPATDFDRTRVDIFWCSGTDQSAEALAAANTLAGKRPATSIADWRVRALSKERNATPGFQVKGQVIRIDRVSERPVANALNGLAGGGFGVQQVVYTTPGYVSVFVCPV